MDCDPKTMLEWLAMPGDLQMVALEQLNMLLLLSDNVDRVFERYATLRPCVGPKPAFPPPPAPAPATSRFEQRSCGGRARVDG